METNQVAKIDFHKRVSVHYQEVWTFSEIGFGKLDSTASAQGMRLTRVLDGNVPGFSITEFVLDLVTEMPRAHHQTANSLVSQLPDQKLKERSVSYRGQRLGRGWHYGPQARPQAAYE
jgi:hypothetical protein